MTRLDRILSGLQKTLNNLPGVIEKWDHLDFELREVYRDQLSQMFSSHFAEEVYKLAEDEGRLETVVATWLDGLAQASQYEAFFEKIGCHFY